MPAPGRDTRAMLICVMLTLSPIAPASAMVGMSLRAGGPRHVETNEEDASARVARVARTAQVGWRADVALVPCPVYGEGTTCTRVAVTTASGHPVSELLGTLDVRFASDADAGAPIPIVERSPGVYLSPAAPDRPGLWDVRVLLGARADAPPAFEFTERLEF